MSKKIQISLASAKAMQPVDIIAAINTGIEIVDAAAPVLKVLFDKLNAFIKSLGGKNSPAGRLKRIEALEAIAEAYAAKDALQKEVNKSTDARLSAIEKKLQIA